MIKNHILPEFLYKLKPFIYIGLGIYVWIKLNTVYAIISGSLLVGAGSLALLMRQSSSYYKSCQQMRQRETKGHDLDLDNEDSIHVTVQ